MKSVGPLSVGEKLIGPPAHAMEKKKKKTGVTGVTTQEQSGRRCWSRRPGRMVLPPSATGPDSRPAPPGRGCPGRSRSPGQPNGPSNTTITGIVIR